jgi:hypothetical protein
VSPRIFPTVRSDFARLIARKFAPARLLFVGSEANQFRQQNMRDGLESTCCTTTAELEELPKSGESPQFDLAIWFYPPESESDADERVLDCVTNLADNLVLIPGPGVNVSKRRPRLVLALASYGFVPTMIATWSRSKPGRCA